MVQYTDLEPSIADTMRRQQVFEALWNKIDLITKINNKLCASF